MKSLEHGYRGCGVVVDRGGVMIMFELTGLKPIVCIVAGLAVIGLVTVGRGVYLMIF